VKRPMATIYASLMTLGTIGLLAMQADAHEAEKKQLKSYRVPYQTTCKLEYKIVNGDLKGPKQDCDTLFKVITEQPKPVKSHSHKKTKVIINGHTYVLQSH